MKMKKTKFALIAVCSASTAAQAQSSVTLYGVLDTAIEYASHVASAPPTVHPTTGAVTQAAGGSRFGMLNAGGVSGPRWGLRGVENLGGGLSALFVLEMGFGVDNGFAPQGGRMFHRQAYVGFQSTTYGKVTFGRQYSTMFDVLADFSPLTYAPTYEPMFAMLGPAFRHDNAIKYAITFGGLSAQAHWSFGSGQGSYGTTTLANGGNGETPGHFRDNTAYGAALTYRNGPFGVVAVYDQWNPAPTAGNAAKMRKAGGALSYTLANAKLVAGYRWNDGSLSTGEQVVRDDLYWVSASYQITPPLELILAYYYDNLKTVRVSAGAPAVDLRNPWQVSFQGLYALSKRTDLYLAVAYAKNSGLNLDTVAGGSGYPLEQGRNSQVGVSLGMRHTF